MHLGRWVHGRRRSHVQPHRGASHGAQDLRKICTLDAHIASLFHPREAKENKRGRR
jgi:hypothetical protein